MKEFDAVIRRIAQLRQMHSRRDQAKEAVRKLCGPPDEAIAFLLGDLGDVSPYSVPAANLVLSGLTRLAQKIGRPADLRIPTPQGDEKERTRKKAEKRGRIVTAWDDTVDARGRECGDSMEATLYQSGLWLPGYTFFAWVVKEGVTEDGHPYPALLNLDPYATYASSRDLAYVYETTASALAERYPEHRLALLGKRDSSGGVLLDPVDYPYASTSAWGGQTSSFYSRGGGSIEVAEYYDDDACWVVVPSKNLVLERYDNPLSGPQFIVEEKYSFSTPVGQYDHTIGLQATIAQFNMLGVLGMKDAVFTEALTLDTPIPTPDGWTTMGALEVGDLVLGADGLPAEVFKATEPQDDRTVYRVTFQDGTHIDASDGHLWQSKSDHQLERVRTTEQMIGGKYWVPAAQPWKLPEADLPIDPYILGMWLGDGRSQGPIITADAKDMPHLLEQAAAAGYTAKPITQADRAPSVYLSRAGAGKGRPGSGLHGALADLELLGNKHIPAMYLRGSIDQRLALLQGLMDSDGFAATKAGNCAFTNSNRRIIDAMLELLRSLGEVPTVKWQDDKRSRYGGYWTIYFTARQFNPFRMARKAAKVVLHKSGKWVRIKSIEKIDTVPVRCIAVANNDHLFLAGPGGHVTHNTNVTGELLSGQYRKGRHAVNYFTPGTQISKPPSQLPYQLFQELDRLERQFRTTAGYSVTDDAVSPAAQATGQGIDRLNAGIDLEVKQYLSLLRRGTQRADRKRLEWADKCYPDLELPIEGLRGGEVFAETYVPRRDIAGQYRTRRTHGAMAGLDDQNKISALLLLRQGDLIDSTSAMEEMDLGGRSVTQIQQRIEDEKVSRTLMELMVSGQPVDPRVAMTLIEMLPESEKKETFKRFWTPETPEMSPEQEAMLQPPSAAEPDIMAMLGLGGGAPGGAPPGMPPMPPEMAGMPV